MSEKIGAATPGNLYTRAQVEAMLEAQVVKLLKHTQ